MSYDLIPFFILFVFLNESATVQCPLGDIYGESRNAAVQQQIPVESTRNPLHTFPLTHKSEPSEIWK